MANAHNTTGNLLQAEGRFEDAATHYQHAIEIDPEFGEAHLNLGQALARDRRLEESIVHLRRGLELCPEDPASHERLALVLRRLHRRGGYRPGAWLGLG